MRWTAIFWCLGVVPLAIAACGTESVDESILPTGDTELGKLHGGSVDALCDWTRKRFAKAANTACALGESSAAPNYGAIVAFSGSSCGPERIIGSDCSVSVDEYDACVDGLVADTCATATTALCAGLGECAVAATKLNLEPSCVGLSRCCEEIEQQGEREPCQAVVSADAEPACGLVLATYLGYCPEANRASD